MTDKTQTDASNRAQAEVAAVRPSGPAPVQPQGAPAGAVQIGDRYVQPLPDGSRRWPAPFAFRDGVLLAQGETALAPEGGAQGPRKG